MKVVKFENVFNKEKFECFVEDLKHPQLIEGIEYIKVHRQGTQRSMLMRKDALTKVKTNIKIK